MDVRLSGEQRALRDAVVQLIDRLGPKSVADLEDVERQTKLAAAVASAGWLELRTAGDDGMPWASAVDAAIVVDELGRGLADVAFVGPTLAAELRRLAGVAPAGRPETVVMAGGLAELASSLAPSPPSHSVAIDAAGADVGLIGIGRPDRLGLGITSLRPADAVALDLTRPSASPSGGATPVGPGGCLTAEDITRWTAFGLALSCADLVGVMRGAIELARDYAGMRKQYGTRIGSFQAVQHLLADAFVAMEGSRSLALHAAWAADALPAPDALHAAAAAKAYTTRAARLACETSIQVHGGIGNTWDCLAHVYLRRSLASSDLFGGVGANLDRVLDGAVGGGHGLR